MTAFSVRLPNGQELELLPGGPYQRCLMPLDYPPSMACKPRWGYSHPPLAAITKMCEREHASYIKILAGIRELNSYFAAIPRTKTKELEPHWLGGSMIPFDLATIYYFLYSLRPATYVEVGSGTSTCFARRAISDHGLPTKIVSIDPVPRAAIDGICDSVIRSGLELLPDLSIFSKLNEGDIVFIDGTHRSFMNSDVTVFMLEVLPRLKPGVVVHFHDIFLPYDYVPYFEHWYWNEQYILAAHLAAARERVRILMPCYYVGRTAGLQELLLPPFLSDLEPDAVLGGGSFWFTQTG
jgi:hypothetical protein